MARRLPRGRTMGYGCPPPLAGGGVAPSNADTRVITALLTTATEGGKWRRDEAREVGVLGGVPHTHTCTSFHPSLLTVLLRHRHKVTRAMKAVRALMIGHRWMNGHMAGWQMDTFICKLPEKQMSQMQMSFLTKMFNDFFL